MMKKTVAIVHLVVIMISSQTMRQSPGPIKILKPVATDSIAVTQPVQKANPLTKDSLKKPLVQAIPGRPLQKDTVLSKTQIKDTVKVKTVQKDSSLSDSLQKKQSEALNLKRTTVAFLGIESISENRFHETLEERIYMRLSYNKYISLEPKDFYFRLKSRGIVKRKLLTMNEAVELLKMSGDRIFVSGEIRNFRIELKRYLGFLPFGKVTGEIVCYLQVLDALSKSPRFAGDVKFTGSKNAGWIGFGLSTENMPLSPIDEKNFVFELVSGTGEAFAETAEAAYAGIIEQKRNPPPQKENPIKRGELPVLEGAPASK